MDFDKYDVIVFDVDGTLYFQNRLRFIMAGRLFRYYLFHLNRIKDLLIIKEFRSIRENAKDEASVYEKTAEKLNVSIEKVRETVSEWIYKNPLDAVYITRDKKLLETISKLREEGKKIVIWSDYYASDKLSVLHLDCDFVYTAEDERVGELKPSHKALDLIISDLNTSKDKVLMIGDRMSKDGKAAGGAGVDFVILGKSEKKRNNFYIK